MHPLIKSFLGNELTTIFQQAQGFIKNQSLNYLNQNEIILSYKDLQKTFNNNSLEHNIIISNISKNAPKQIQFTLEHQEYKFIANINLELNEFILSNTNAHVLFSFIVEKLCPTKDASFWHKTKITAIGFMLKLFPNYINSKLFEHQDLTQGIKSSIIDNKIKLDFKEFLLITPLGKTFLGFNILDLIQITNINVHRKGFGIRFNISIPEWLKHLLILLISIISKQILKKLSLIRFLKYMR